MAHYQNGLHLVGDALYKGGYVFSRWLFEWLTQVVGWTALDHNDSKWVDVIASGSGVNQGDTTSNSKKVDMSASGRSWTSADADRYITITGLSTPGRDGIYRIRRVETGDIVVLDVLHGVHDAGLPSGESFNWRLWGGTSTYYPASLSWAVMRASYSHVPAEPNFDIRLVCNGNGKDGIPTVSIGPFGTWDNVGHAWVGSRNTAQQNVPAVGYTTEGFVWAHADDHGAVVTWHTYNANNGYRYPCILYLGEMQVQSIIDDTNPGVIANGARVHTSDTYWPRCVGYQGDANIYESFRWMSKLPANDTEVSGEMHVPFAKVNIGEHLMDVRYRFFDNVGRNVCRTEIALECVQSGHMEHRGVCRNLWASHRALPNFNPLGSAKSYLHAFGGLCIPWNGSDVHWIR